MAWMLPQSWAIASEASQATRRQQFRRGAARACAQSHTRNVTLTKFFPSYYIFIFWINIHLDWSEVELARAPPSLPQIQSYTSFEISILFLYILQPPYHTFSRHSWNSLEALWYTFIHFWYASNTFGDSQLIGFRDFAVPTWAGAHLSALDLLAAYCSVTGDRAVVFWPRPVAL